MDVLLLALEYVDTIESSRSSSVDDHSDIIDYDRCVKASNFETRKSCHSCGNVRKTFHKCPICPHIFCRNCTKKMTAMYGKTVFSSKSCPVCANLCCCANKSSKCCKRYHCYRKCPVSRADVPRNPQTTLTRTNITDLARGQTFEQRLLLSCPRTTAMETEMEDTSIHVVSPTMHMPTTVQTRREIVTKSQPQKITTISHLSSHMQGGYQNQRLPGLISCGLLAGIDDAT